ncbi:alkaline shock response membrane anchor protein AmaP [Sphaerisporangium perillae]|uniref:alkaline shock response membrane anchor protein AmaP n=1 Tax=Sphaerisporangium perillae TaxID=2935860 RepID=UPI00200DBFC8|nr:alkaline shock response membrane anchor protein AmaP [Sphaerisporangium perillae]
MSHRNARVNRTGLAILGLILTLAGALALAKGLGLLGPRHVPVISPQIAGFAARTAWFWPALALVALVVELLALRWLLLEARRDTVRYLNLEEADPGHGATHLSARAAAGALEDDLAHSIHEERTPGGGAGVHGRGAAHGERVSATLTGAPTAPSLALAVVLPDESDPAAARKGIQHAVARLRRSLETERLPATVRMHTVRTHH